MTKRQLTLTVLSAVMLWFGRPARAYVDLAPTLGSVIRDSQTISLVEVEKFSRENAAVILKKVRDLKGKTDAEPIRHQIAAPGQAMPRNVLEWAEPGRRAVLFVSSNTALVCLGKTWYQVQSSTGGWWKPGPSRPDLPLAYCGTVSRLADAVPMIVAGKTAVITMIPHGTDGAASVDLALNRPSLPGFVRLQRIRANLRMPQMTVAVSANPGYLIGPGSAGEEDIPALIEKLGSNDATVREESADDLRSLGPKAAPAAATLEKLLADGAAQVRTSAAATLLCIHPGQANAIETLRGGMNSSEAAVRRSAARAAGLAGPSAAALAGRLAALLSDEDELTRFAALEAVAMLGPAAANDAMRPVIKLLDDPQMAVCAADALGRMGAAARPAQKRIAQLLTSSSRDLQWAAVRAMSQIGGEDAAPAVQFMMRELHGAGEVDGYNMMIYIALLGPAAKDAIPAIQSAFVKQPALRPAALWAIQPEKQFPWQGAGGGRLGMSFEGDIVVGSIYECLVNEMGEHLKPASRVLAQKIMDGTAGEVPLWGYRILSRFPDEALPC